MIWSAVVAVRLSCTWHFVNTFFLAVGRATEGGPKYCVGFLSCIHQVNAGLNPQKQHAVSTYYTGLIRVYVSVSELRKASKIKMTIQGLLISLFYDVLHFLSHLVTLLSLISYTLGELAVYNMCTKNCLFIGHDSLFIEGGDPTVILQLLLKSW